MTINYGRWKNLGDCIFMCFFQKEGIKIIRVWVLVFLCACLGAPPVWACVTPEQRNTIVCRDIYVQPVTTSGGYTSVPGSTWNGGSQTTVGSTSHYGTGEYYANAPCPQEQRGIPPAVISRSEILRVEADELVGRLDELKTQLKSIKENTDYTKCENAVNKVIREVCGIQRSGDYDESAGEDGVDFYEIHMISDGAISLYNKAPQYLRTYKLVSESFGWEEQGFMQTAVATEKSSVSSPNSGRFPAEADGDGNGNGDGTGDGNGNGNGSGNGNGDGNGVHIHGDLSCEDFACENGYIDHKICFQPQLKVSRKIKETCKKCLNPRHRPPKGIYPSDFKRAYHLQQEIAVLEKQVAFARGKAACVDRHVDGPLSEGRHPDSRAYRKCIRTVDPQATSAEYCLFCNLSGQTVAPKKPGFKEILPALLTTGVWAGLGIYAHKQSKKISQGNWEAGYPTDDRHSWKAANYLLGGLPMVINSWQSTGAFGCAPTSVNGQGHLATNAVGNFSMNNNFNGSPNVQVNGANGYPPHLIWPFNPAAYSGSFSQGTHVGSWDPALNGHNNPAVLQEQIRRQEAELQFSLRQNQERMAALGRLQSIQTQMNQLSQQSAMLNGQLGSLNSQYQSVYSSIGGAGSSNYGPYPGASSNGSALGNIRVGWDMSGWGGVGSHLGAGNNYPPQGPYRPGPEYNRPPYNRGPSNGGPRPGRSYDDDGLGLGLPPPGVNR